jgi:4-hydroxybenzoate polyprenyltransferase
MIPKALFRLVRPLNLAIMASTLILVRYCLFLPVFQQNGLGGLMPGWQFLLLVAATVFIGAGGYVINDVLDIELDKVNKPQKQVIGTLVSDEKGKKLHFNLTAVGVAFGIAFSYFAGNIMLGILFVIIPTALFYYSYKYKYLPAAGNLVVAALSALTVIIYWVFEFYHLKGQPDEFIEASRYFLLINHLLLPVAGFAFLVSLTREIVKDIQDLEGDTRFGCKTLPVVMGVNGTRLLAVILQVLTMIGLAWFQVSLFRTGFELMAYLLISTQVLAGTTLILTVFAGSKAGYSRVSLMLKILMLSGMLSLIATWFRNLS